MPPFPERIGRYLILGELGRGAMGVVYRGRDESLDREVALKVMTKGAADEAARARFQREARAAARLQHPNIVVIYELGEHVGSPYMALELLEGTDLQRAIEDGIRPDPRHILPLVLQILAGLGHAHEYGIVHRDVKPSNVFLPLGRPAKIMDFGVARLSGAGATTAGMLSGTPSYMSPEQVTGEEVDGRSDLFSVGLMLYELVTGEKAIRAESIAATLYKILHETPDLSLIPPGKEWRRLHAVLERALAHRRDDRYPDARAMSADLTLALADLGGPVEGSHATEERLLMRRRATTTAATPASGIPMPAMPAPRTPAHVPSEAQAAPRPAPVVRPRRPLVLGSLVGAVLLMAAGWIAVRTFRSRPEATPAPQEPAISAPGPAPSAGGLSSEASSPPETVPPPLPAAAPSVAPVTEVTASPVAEVSVSPPEPSPSSSTPVVAQGAQDGLARARSLLELRRWEEALAAARAVLETAPTNAEATALAQQAEAEVVIERCLRNARAALRQGDRERALDEIRNGFLVRANDPRLLELHREAVQP